MMAGHDFKKNSGSLRAGYLYQDLVAIEILIDFYRNRDLYKWVQIEAEETAFRSIEDVVACMPDGRFKLTQVKFTVDPDASTNRLSWKWLTEKKKVKGTSLLQKWASTTLKLKEAGKLAWAGLKTDRVPDATFRECLSNGKIDCSKLTADVRSQVEEQIGSYEMVESFFESFEFIHSFPMIDDLENELWLRVASDTDKGGWYAFLDKVRHWSMRKNRPHPDGKIRYGHLYDIFLVDPSKPIAQDFQVPTDYTVPDKNFESAFLSDLAGSDGISVLWGPPGSGKSTFLSHCVARASREEAVYVRHHYFLSLTDRSEDRYHFHAIDQSLRHQIRVEMERLEISGLSLKEILETTARNLKETNRRLIVIIDGLDHVWRDHRDHEEMEKLFDMLLPLPPNMRLVVGTQKVANEHLPKKLLKALPAECWTELPLMTLAAVHGWLRFQDKDGRLKLKTVGQQRKGKVFGMVARAFHRISNGLPLHLIYSLKEISETGKTITAEDVAALPDCPTGEIRDYYRNFWDRADEKAKTILHVLAGLEFGPPPFSVRDCFGHSLETVEAFAQIDHLLDRQETEIRPFHSSLFAFVRDLSEHRNAFRANASGVLDWLETQAPDYWSWAWLWITKAQLGKSEDLLSGPSRDWAIDSVVAGYPIEQTTVILDRAEKVAFERFDLPRFLSLRSLKERAILGPDYQTNDWHIFREVGISLSDDPYVRSILQAEIHSAPARILPYIVGNADECLREHIAEKTIDELERRAKLYDFETDRNDRMSELVHALAAVTGHTKTENIGRVVDLTQKNAHAADSLMAHYAQTSLLAFNLKNVFAAGKQYTSPKLDREILTALCLEGLAPSSVPGLKGSSHPAVRCLSLLKGHGVEWSPVKMNLAHLFVKDDAHNPELSHRIRFAAYETFFAALAAGLLGTDALGWMEIHTDARETWLGQALLALERLAEYFSEVWHTMRQWPKLNDIYREYSIHPPMSPSFRERSDFKAIRLALRDAAIDLCTLAIGFDANSLIEAREIEAASSSPFWLDNLWIEAFCERRLPLHKPEAARIVVQRAGNLLDAKITESNERATDAAKLALFASDNGVRSLAKKELRRATECVISYGWHKDMFAREVLKSLELLANRDNVQAKNALLDLAGEFEAITSYTDRDETDYIRERFYRSIAAHFPDRIPTCYANLIRQEDWRYAQTLSTALVECGLVDSRPGLALTESYIEPPEARSLEEVESASRPYIRKALADVRRKTGKAFIEKSKSEQSLTSSYLDSNVDDAALDSTEEFVPDPSEFPPGRFQDYLSAVRRVESYYDRKELVTEWLRRWQRAECADDALTNFESAVLEGMPGHELEIAFDRAYDVAFEIALQLRGRSQAYPWLVRAHVARFAWLPNYTGEAEALNRFRVVAQHYRGKWRKFVMDSSKPLFAFGAARNGIYIGHYRLVALLLEVGELEFAKNYALEMARIFKEELREQPIETPEWSK